MAVSIVSDPPISPTWTSVGDSFPVEVSSSVFGTPGVTQHRFRADVTALVNLGTRYTVVDNSAFPYGNFDFVDLFKTLLQSSEQEWGGAQDITQITVPTMAYAFELWGFQVVYSEEYYLNGVFTQGSGPTRTYISGRGYRDPGSFLWKYANWWQRNGLSKFMPYTGQTYQVYPQRLEDAAWEPKTTHSWMNIQVDEIGGGPIANWWFQRNVVGNQQVTYFPIYFPGTSDLDGFVGITVRIYLSTVSGSGGILKETYSIERTVSECVDEEKLIMFKDSNYKWAFMSFTKKHRETINVDKKQDADSIINGRYRYNVEASETLTLNTDWMNENQNELVRDMMVSEYFYLVNNSDGSLEPVVIVPNSLRLQTSRNDGLIQYQVSFKKSQDIFVA
jgi:hypothetical protein